MSSHLECGDRLGECHLIAGGIRGALEVCGHECKV